MRSATARATYLGWRIAGIADMGGVVGAWAGGREGGKASYSRREFGVVVEACWLGASCRGSGAAQSWGRGAGVAGCEVWGPGRALGSGLRLCSMLDLYIEADVLHSKGPFGRRASLDADCHFATAGHSHSEEAPIFSTLSPSLI